MSSTTSDGVSARQTRLLQYYLLSSTVPYKAGGGVVFPNGFPGIGYQLDEWQFERYRARLDRGTLGDAARKRQRVALVLLIVFILAIIAISFTAPLFSNHPAIAPYLDSWGIAFDSWTLLPLLLLAALVFRRVQRQLTTQSREQGETQSFDGSPTVSRFAYLPRRTLGMLASRQVSITAQHVRLLIACGIGLVLLGFAVSQPGFLGENLFLAAMLVVWMLRPAFFCWVYWRFRLAHGRAPQPSDLEPV